MITVLMARSRCSSSMECVLGLGSEGFNHVAHLNRFGFFFAFNVNAEMLKSRKENDCKVQKGEEVTDEEGKEVRNQKCEQCKHGLEERCYEILPRFNLSAETCHQEIKRMLVYVSYYDM